MSTIFRTSVADYNPRDISIPIIYTITINFRDA